MSRPFKFYGTGLILRFIYMTFFFSFRSFILFVIYPLSVLLIFRSGSEGRVCHHKGLVSLFFPFVSFPLIISLLNSFDFRSFLIVHRLLSTLFGFVCHKEVSPLHPSFLSNVCFRKYVSKSLISAFVKYPLWYWLRIFCVNTRRRVGLSLGLRRWCSTFRSRLWSLAWRVDRTPRDPSALFRRGTATVTVPQGAATNKTWSVVRPVKLPRCPAPLVRARRSVRPRSPSELGSSGWTRRTSLVLGCFLCW